MSAQPSKSMWGCKVWTVRVIVLSSVLALSQVSVGEEKQKKTPLEIDFTLDVGYRVDDLDWSIAGDLDGSSPNILSELSWEELRSAQVLLQGNIVWPWVFAVKGYVDYGWIMDGDNQDSDYLGDNRTFEFSRSNNDAGDGDVRDASLAIGYPFRFGEEAIATITPLVGYSYHGQNLRMTDGYQTIPASGPLSGLDSTYETEWDGAWVGLDMRFKALEFKIPGHRVETFFTCEYHWYDYYAEADWNLRPDFKHPKSFVHETDGNGLKLEAGFNIWLRDNFAFNLKYDYVDFSAEEGIDTTFFSDGTSGQTQLNEVNWTFYVWSMGVSVRY